MNIEGDQAQSLRLWAAQNGGRFPSSASMREGFGGRSTSSDAGLDLRSLCRCTKYRRGAPSRGIPTARRLCQRRRRTQPRHHGDAYHGDASNAQIPAVRRRWVRSPCTRLVTLPTFPVKPTNTTPQREIKLPYLTTGFESASKMSVLRAARSYKLIVLEMPISKCRS
jgi:hypothetical protein